MSKAFAWSDLRRGVAAGDTPLAAATFDDAPPTTAQKVDEYAPGRLLAAYGTGSADSTALVNIYGYRAGKGPALLLAALTFTLGTMQANTDPVTDAALTSNFYFDTIAVTTEGGLLDTELGNGTAVNEMAVAILREQGFDTLFAEVETLTGVTKFNLIQSVLSGVVVPD